MCVQAERKLKVSTVPDLDNASVGKIIDENLWGTLFWVPCFCFLILKREMILMSKIQKLTMSGTLIAVGVICSAFYIPLGVAKCFPVQHLINVLAGVLLGPVYAVAVAFCTSFLRLILGTGSVLAFPGSMCGAVLCSMLYKYTKNTTMAFLGEVVGTGGIGAVLAYPIASIFLSKPISIFTFVIPFGASSVVGATISVVLLVAIKRTGVLVKAVQK